MTDQPQPGQPVKVPAKAKHRVKVIIEADGKKFQEETNKFLESISDQRLLKGIVFSLNIKTGEMVHVINYSDLSPMTPEEWKEKQKKQAEFSKGFIPSDLMPNGSKVEEM